jgi:DNA-binding IclR family transcriptional regulator
VGIDREEYLVGVTAVASPVHGLGGELLALIWIVGFSVDFTDEALARAIRALREETRAVGEALGAESSPEREQRK